MDMLTDYISVTGDDHWTSAIGLRNNIGELAITGSFTATVTLQVSYDGTNWVDVETFTTADHKTITGIEGTQWRAGIDTGDYTSGTVTVRLSTK